MWRDRLNLLNLTDAFLQLTATNGGQALSATRRVLGEGLEEVGTGGLFFGHFSPKKRVPDLSPETQKIVGNMGADTAWDMLFGWFYSSDVTLESRAVAV